MLSQDIENQPKDYGFTVFNAINESSITVSFRRTAIGWYNLYLPRAKTAFANVPPDMFLRLFPDFSGKAKAGSDAVRNDDIIDVIISAKKREGSFVLWNLSDFIGWRDFIRLTPLPLFVAGNLDNYYTVIRSITEMLKEVIS